MQDSMQDYRRHWQQFIHDGVMQEDVLPPPMRQSWQRCSTLGFNAYQETSVHDQPAYTLATSYPLDLLALIRPVMEDLHQFTEGSACVVAFADGNATIIDLVGNPAMRQTFEQLGLAIGASWSEEQQGTNALALALRESFPIQIAGAMHYRSALHAVYTSAAPIHNLLGQTIGVLAVIGQHKDCHPHTLGMITAAAQAINNQLQMQVWLNNANDLLSELQTILQSLPEGILLLRRDGVVSQMNTPAGKMLGLIPEHVTGRYLRDVLPLPAMLAHALTTQQLLSDEEVVFDTMRGRVTCLCTLKPFTIPPGDSMPEYTRALAPGKETFHIESDTTDGFIMILRSIERAQKLAQRILGTHARLTFANVIGANPQLQEALRLAHLASGTNSTVLLHGETGTGKEIFAHSIHNFSARADGPFVAINCAAIPRELITTELFGYEGGAFTGADRQGRTGKFEQAHKGTLLLDEIGDMPLDLQASLLRAIETHSIVRIGGQRVIAVDVRVIAATHKDLREEVKRGTFRSDLYYRLNVLTITIPALRARAEDIPLLVQHFLQRQSRILGHALTITPEALQALQHYTWPGNVRELENMLERVTYLIPKTTITIDDLPIDVQKAHHPTQIDAEHDQPLLLAENADAARDLKKSSMNAEMQAIASAYQASGGHMLQAATQLGISRTTLWRKMVKYGLLASKDKT